MLLSPRDLTESTSKMPYDGGMFQHMPFLSSRVARSTLSSINCLVAAANFI
jgi:hypothetical protein